jgi:outer membrane receptor protein involved in Fe transport
VRDTDRFVEEVRLSSQLEGPWQFIVGLFYEDVEQFLDSQFNWDGSASTNPFAPTIGWALQQDQLDLQQKAIFGELSYAFDERWELTIGGRYFDYDRVDKVTQLPSVFFPASENEVDASETGNTLKANISFTPNDDVLLYAQWSEGFRLGKGQARAPSDCDLDMDGKLDGTNVEITDQVGPDTTENFELGAKLSLLDNRLTLNTAVFNIDWLDLPAKILGNTPACPGGFGVEVNIGEANSKGVEMEAAYLVTPQLAINFSASYIEAEWVDTEGTPAQPGESLSFAPRTNANLGVQYDFDFNQHPAFVRTDVSYVGEYQTSFENFGFGEAGDYVNVNMRLGVNIDQWSLALYGTNLTNELAVVHSSPASEYLVKPRRIGFEARYSF